MIPKSFWFSFLLGTVVNAAARLDNAYLPPTGGGNGNTLQESPSSTSSASSNLPRGVENSNNQNPEAGAAILKFENVNDPETGYRFEYETENQIHHSESGVLKNIGEENEVMVVEGSYSYMGPDGVMYTVTYIADENGFRATGEHIPTGAPIPATGATVQDSMEQQGSNTMGHGHDSPYHREHNQDTQAVIIEAQPQHEPQPSATREYLPPRDNQQDNSNTNGYRY